MNPATPRAMKLAREILDAGAGVFYVAANETQRAKALQVAARILEPRLREIEAESARNAAQNPS